MNEWPDRFPIENDRDPVVVSHERAEFLQSRLLELGPPMFTSIQSTNVVAVGERSRIVIGPEDLLQLINGQNAQP